MPKGELSTRGVVLDAFREGKYIFVPYIHQSQSQDPVRLRSMMDMVSLHSKEDYENLLPDAWGIPSIAENSLNERYSILEGLTEGANTSAQGTVSSSSTNNPIEGKRQERLDVIVMPGVAFDQGLRRLGHGKGFYDHFLERYRSSTASPMPSLGEPPLTSLDPITFT